MINAGAKPGRLAGNRHSATGAGSVLPRRRLHVSVCIGVLGKASDDTGASGRREDGHLCGSVGFGLSHIAWLRTIQERIEYKGMKNVEVNFPVISDLKMEVSKAFGMLQPEASTPQAVRGVFTIDPEATVRAILFYPMENGRNTQESKRLLTAMQYSDAHQVATPANWEPGEDAIVPPPHSTTAARERVDSAGEGYRCLDWFLCLKPTK